MRYGDGAVQWMTAGRGMLHEEMWDTDARVDAELYQLWVNLPPRDKLVPPRVQVLLPPNAGADAAEVQREGSTPVVRATLRDERRGPVRVRTLAQPGVSDASGGRPAVGALTYSPMSIEHVEFHEEGATYTLPLPEGWTCIVYVRRGEVAFGDDGGKARMYDTAYLSRRGGDGLVLTSAHSGLTDVLVLAGEPLGAPVVTSGTMVMNSDSEVRQAMYDYQRGEFGVPWPHEMSDDEWAEQCDARRAARQR